MKPKTSSSWSGTAAFGWNIAAIVEMGPEECCVVPRGMEHRTCAESEAEILCFEPCGVRNTGDIADADFTAPPGVKI